MTNIWTGTTFASLVAVSVLVGGCALDPSTDATFREAQKQYNAVQADPDVKAYARVALVDAGDTLAQARKAENTAALHHFSYLAMKKTEIARTLAEARLDDHRLRSLPDKAAAKPDDRHKIVKEPLPPVPVPQIADDKKAQKREQQALQAAREAQKRVKSLEKALAQFKVREEMRSVVLTLPDVSFAPGDTRLNPAVERRLEPLAEYLGANPQRKIVVKGYTDNIGSHAANLAISDERAKAVKSYLVGKGIQADRILTIGYGETDPVARNATAAGRRENRRVEIVLVDARASAQGSPSREPPSPQSQGARPKGTGLPDQRP